MLNPSETSVAQRIVGLYSATRELNKLISTREGRKAISHPDCIGDLKSVRDALSRLLNEVER